MATERNPSRNEVLQDVRAIIGEHMGMTPGEIREKDHLVNDLGCDSLDVVEIAMLAEEHFQLDVPDEFSEQAQTVGAIVDGVLELLGERLEA